MGGNISRKEFLISLAAIGFGSRRLQASSFLSEFNSARFLKTDGPLIIKPEDAQYNKLRASFNKRISHHPAAIALCRSTDDVLSAIGYAKKNSLTISCRSGGHSFEGYSTVDNSLVLDFSLLNSAQLHDDGSLLVGPGCRLSKIYDTILPHGRIIPAGSCGNVGIGGLALGGGYGLFSRKFGLTCDNLTDAVVVSTDGTVHTASSEKDLLWALRGGGTAGIGIVTSMTFNTHPAPATLTSHHFKSRKLDLDSATQLLQTWFSVASDLPNECFSAFVLNGSTLNILVTEFHHSGNTEAAALQPLVREMETARFGKPLPLARAVKTYYGKKEPIYFKNASAGLYTGFEDIREAMKEALPIVLSTPGMIYQINTLGGEIRNPAFERASAFPHRKFGFLSELQTYWDSPHQEEHLLRRFGDVQNIIRNHGIVVQYANYPSAEFKNWKVAYYGENYERLRSVKRRFDSGNLLSHPQSIGI
jgi:FAD/FMN-containing dehydrogenase